MFITRAIHFSTKKALSLTSNIPNSFSHLATPSKLIFFRHFTALRSIPRISAMCCRNIEFARIMCWNDFAWALWAKSPATLLGQSMVRHEMMGANIALCQLWQLGTWEAIISLATYFPWQMVIIFQYSRNIHIIEYWVFFSGSCHRNVKSGNLIFQFKNL